MSGLFGSPKPPAPLPPALPDNSEEEERKKRLATMLRRRRGRAATIATSDRGLLTPLNENTGPAAKSLLGE